MVADGESLSAMTGSCGVQQLKMRTHYTQIDIMKGLAILGVIVIHSSVSSHLLPNGGYLWLAQAVPVFMVLLGLNLALSLQGRPPSFSAAYASPYWKSRWRRVFVPFVVVFGLSALIALASSVLGGLPANVGGFTLVGVLPTGGPGNYFLTVLFQFVIVGPLLWVAFRRTPQLTLVSALVVDVAFEVWADSSILVAEHPYIGEAWIARYALAIVIGLWLAEGWALEARRNRLLLIAGLVSGAYLALSALAFSLVPRGLDFTPTVYFVSYLYTGLLVMVGMAILPSVEVGPTSRFLAKAGRLSYHIFLVQILWFATLVIPTQRFISASLEGMLSAVALDALLCAINVAVCLAGGALFYVALRPRSTGRPGLNAT